MTDYSKLVSEGRIKPGRFSRKQVEDCLEIARRDLKTAGPVVETSPEWTFNFPEGIRGGHHRVVRIRGESRTASSESCERTLGNYRNEVVEKDTRVQLNWAANIESGVVACNVYKDGNLVPIKSVDSSTLNVEDLALTNGKQYSYRVQAVDAAGNMSPLSDPIAAIPAAGPEWAP